MLIAAVGIILSIIGIFAVRTNENATIKQLLKAFSHRNELEFRIDRYLHVRDSLCIRHGELVLDRLFRDRRSASRNRDRAGDGILYSQSYKRPGSSPNRD